MAVTPKQTANYNLPLHVVGLQALRKAVVNGFNLIDAALNSIQGDLTTVEGRLDVITLDSDSNSVATDGTLEEVLQELHDRIAALEEA